jgi:Domain of unknown function (DUF4037)
MSDPYARTFSPRVQAVIDDIVPIVKEWDVGRYAISIGGSTGKDMIDAYSDIDFRLFYERPRPGPDVQPETWSRLIAAIARWKERGINIDGVWGRSIREMDAQLDRWLNGELIPDDITWAVWGYYLLPDLYHQAIVEDLYGIIRGWKERLRRYPPKLKQAILDKHLLALRYWRADYHYVSKVKRGDVVFLAGLSAKLVHHMMQVLFAINETYFVGDGQNLEFAEQFRYKPASLSARVTAALYLPPSDRMLDTQREVLMGLIDDIERLLAEINAGQS